MSHATTAREIAESKSLTRAEKIAKLRQLAYDARERDVAAEEGMTSAGARSGLQAILAALRELGASEDPRGDAKQ